MAGVVMDQQIELFALRWRIKVRSFVNDVWRNQVFGISAILLSATLCVYWSWRTPSPGKAVAAMAVAAAVMTFRGEIGGLEKFFWMVVLFAFLFLELRAIDRDRAIYASEQAEVRKAEHEAFQKI